MCVFVSKINFGGKQGKTLKVHLCCLSFAVSPYQARGLTKARDPCQAVLDICTGSECSWETESYLRKLVLISYQSGIRPRCGCTSVHVFNTPTESQSHWPIYSTMEMAKTQEADQTHRGRNNTQLPYGFINSFTWNSFKATFTRNINGLYGQKKSIVLISLHPDSFLQCENATVAKVTAENLIHIGKVLSKTNTILCFRPCKCVCV